MEINKMKEVNIKQYRIGHEPCMQKKNMPEDLAESMAIMEKRGFRLSIETLSTQKVVGYIEHNINEDLNYMSILKTETAEGFNNLIAELINYGIKEGWRTYVYKTE